MSQNIPQPPAGTFGCPLWGDKKPVTPKKEAPKPYWPMGLLTQNVLAIAALLLVMSLPLQAQVNLEWA